MNTVIIVPTDFSAASINASEYAADFAMATHATLKLVHIWRYPLNLEVPVTAGFIDQLILDATNNVEEAKQNLLFNSGGKLSITAEVRQGFFLNELQLMCENQPHALIVMGAHVTSATERVIFGSTILTAVRNLSCPLIIVPNGTRFTGIHTAGLACDLRDALHTVHAEDLKHVFNEFHPQLNILHVSTKAHGMLDDEEIRGTHWLKETLKLFNPSFHYMQEENISEAIKEFAEKNNIDLLIIIPKKHGMFNRLLHKSQSKQMIVNTHTPILSIHE